MTLAPRPRSTSSRGAKTKNFLPFKCSASRRGVWGEPQIKMIGNFWVLPRASKARAAEAQVSFVKILRILSEIHSNFVQYTPPIYFYEYANFNLCCRSARGLGDWMARLFGNPALPRFRRQKGRRFGRSSAGSRQGIAGAGRFAGGDRKISGNGGEAPEASGATCRHRALQSL